jgi:hypothetical protein
LKAAAVILISLWNQITVREPKTGSGAAFLKIDRKRNGDWTFADLAADKLDIFGPCCPADAVCQQGPKTSTRLREEQI